MDHIFSKREVKREKSSKTISASIIFADCTHIKSEQSILGCTMSSVMNLWGVVCLNLRVKMLTANGFTEYFYI